MFLVVSKYYYQKKEEEAKKYMTRILQKEYEFILDNQKEEMKEFKISDIR